MSINGSRFYFQDYRKMAVEKKKSFSLYSKKYPTDKVKFETIMTVEHEETPEVNSKLWLDTGSTK